jgi:hypothetical protein
MTGRRLALAQQEVADCTWDTTGGPRPELIQTGASLTGVLLRWRARERREPEHVLDLVEGWPALDRPRYEQP